MKQRLISRYHFEENAFNRANPERVAEEMAKDEEETFYDKPFLKIVKKDRWKVIYKKK